MQPTGDGVLQVEPTDHCNLTCTMCAPHHEGWDQIHRIPKGYLDPDLWENILDTLVAEELRFDHLIFQWLGDPSLHPELPRLVGAAARRLRGRVGYLRVDTNGIRMDPSRIERLLTGLEADSPPLLVVFTLDAAAESTYLRVKGRDHLARVRQHIRYLVRRRHQLDRRVNLQFQFVVQEGNHQEAGDFLAYWSDLLRCQADPARFHDEILFKRLSVSGGGPGQAAADALYERTISRAGIRPGTHPGAQVVIWENKPWQADDGAPKAKRSACPGLWLTPVIRHDGHLMMCCADLPGELDLGSLAGGSYRALWEGTLATSRRIEQLAGRFSGPCKSCGGINWYQTTPEMAEHAHRRARELGIVEESQWNTK